MRDLRVTLVQESLFWEQPEANRAHFDALLSAASPATDLIMLPEMFTTGFSMSGKAIAEPPAGETQDWMQALAQRFDCAVTGSLAVEERGQVYNRLLFVTPTDVTVYDKRHLFRMAEEHKTYSPGLERKVINWRDWRIKPEICYDLRFPVFTRNRDDYDLLFFVANWPSPRAHHWRTLLQARAIENLACVVGLNRVGSDPNGHSYSGDSLAIDAAGTLLADLGAERALETVCFSAEALLDYRERFPTPQDADSFSLQL